MKRGNRPGESCGEFKPAPFLQEAQKKCGTPASVNRAQCESWCRAEGLVTYRRKEKYARLKAAGTKPRG
jgi:hypothetical protein